MHVDQHFKAAEEGSNHLMGVSVAIEVRPRSYNPH